MKNKKLLCTIFIITLFCASLAKAEPAKFYVPPSQFNAAFQIMDMGFANIFGLFQSATGSFSFDETAQKISKVKIAIDASSLMTANPKNRRDLLVLFAAQKYPEITFIASSEAIFKEGKAEISGTLSVHGVSKPAKFEATLNHVGKSPYGGGMWNSEGDAIGISLRGSFSRAEFGMGDEPELPGRFGEKITLMLDMQALKQ